MVKPWKRDAVFLLIALFVIAVDQLTKLLSKNIQPAIHLIGNIFVINPTRNYGAGFSLLQGSAPLLAWFAVVVIGVIVYYYYDIPDKLRVYVALLLGGTVGNLIDRAVFGYVMDFFDINIWSGYVAGIYFKIWPAFNIADAAIFAGVIALIAYYWKR